MYYAHKIINYIQKVATNRQQNLALNLIPNQNKI